MTLFLYMVIFVSAVSFVLQLWFLAHEKTRAPANDGVSSSVAKCNNDFRRASRKTTSLFGH